MSSPAVFQSISNFLSSSKNQKPARWLEQHHIPESAVIMVTALIVGIGAGLGAVAFRWLIDTMQMLSFEKLGGLLESIAPFHLLIIPALGGMIVGPMIYFFAREAKGHGVPEVMAAVALEGGRIRPQVAIVKSLASSICIGTGGSVGREGPIAQIGSALGSTVGQLLQLPEDRVRNLVACGAAGGIAATFHAPIAGAIFAMEVILDRMNTLYFGAVVISSVTASVISQHFEGTVRAFDVPDYMLVSPWELLLYSLLGILAAILAIAFTRLLYYSEDQWDKIPIPEWVKPAIGGLVLGIIGILTFKNDGMPLVFGVGYSSISEVLFGHLSLQVALALLVVKLVATITTLGSGGSGGVFAPSLFMGAMLGSGFGQLVNLIFPEITAPSGAYALVGMAAFFSGAARAPITSILILFEMTGDYRIILPLMLTTVISTLISRIISKESIYTLKLARRGVHLSQGHDIDVMQGVTVREVMTSKVDTVYPFMSLEELSHRFDQSHHHSFPVVDNAGNLEGFVRISDLDRLSALSTIKGRITQDILIPTPQLLVTYPEEPMWKALKRMGARGVKRLPVLDKEGSYRLIGVIYASDIVRAYSRAISNRARAQHKSDALRLGKIDDANFIEIEIPENAAVIGKRIRDINLPDNLLIISIRRKRKLHIATGYTILHPGDMVTAFTEGGKQEIAINHLTKLEVSTRTPDHYQARHIEVTVPVEANCNGRMIKDISLPPDIILVSILRDDVILIPHGDTILETGDVIEIFGLEDELKDVENNLTCCT
jgi:chloride channel protein, CIC family